MTQSLAIPRVIPNDWKRLDLIVNKIKMRLGSGSSPTFIGITVTGLTASRLIGTNASKALESVTVGTGLDYSRPNLTLSHLGIEDLTDPGADRIMFWDDSASACKWLVPNTLISITNTNLNVDNDLHNYSWASVDATDLKVGSVTQAWDAQLDDIAALAVTDGNFIVGDGTNWVAESGATARTSIGLGTGDSPLFTAVSIGNADTTITRVGAGVIAVEGTTVMLVGDAPTAHTHDGDTLQLDGVNSNGGAFNFATSGDLTFQPATDGTTRYQWLDANGGTPVLNIDTTNERVGVGTATPSLKFDVKGVANTTFTNCPLLMQVHTLDAYADGMGGGISLGGRYDATHTTTFGYIAGVKDGAGAGDGDTAGKLILGARPTGGGGVDMTAVTILGTGALTGKSTATFEGASVTVGKASTTTGTLVLHDSGSANTITLTVPDSLAGSLTFTLPPTDGDNLDVLQTNGSGVLTWVALSGQTQGDVLDDLNTLGANPFSGDPNLDFLVGTSAGTLAWHSGATARTSIGLGTGNSPTFSNLTVTNSFSIVDLSTTGDTQLGDNVALDNVGINVTPDADVLIKGSFVSTGSGDTFCYNDELFTHTEDDSTASTYIYGTNSVMQVNDDLTVNGIFTAIGHRQFLETNLTTITGVNNPVAYLYGYHAVVDWGAAALSAATYGACVVGFKADVTGNLGTTGNTIKWGADISVSESAVTNYGGRFTAQGADYNYGVWGYTTGAHTTNYGLYGYAAGATTNWGLYVATGNAYFGSDIGNIATPLAALHFESSSYPVGKFVRTTAAASGTLSGYQLLTRTSADMIDGFGGGIILSIEDDTSGEQAIARIYAFRDGADNEGKLILKAGTNGDEPFLTIRADGGIHMPNLKSGANQGAAGAAANELWIDTADNSIKIGV